MKLIIYFIFITLFIATTWIGSSEGCTSHMIEERIEGKLSQTTDESSGTFKTHHFLTEAGAYPQLLTKPNFLIIFKLIQ